MELHLINGSEIAIDVRGQGHPVLFIHGALGQIEIWAEPMEVLSATRRVIAYEGQEEWGYHIAAQESEGESSRTAPAITIPALLDSLDEDRIDYLKMDIEGAEARLLSDSATWLTQVESLNVELHPPASMVICAAVLANWGFEVSASERHGATLVAVRQRPARTRFGSAS